MKAVLQRVSRAEVSVEGRVVGQIQRGWLVLLGVAEGDADEDVAWLVDKVHGLRAFEDEEGRMNRDVHEAGGAVLAVSQFTLLGDCRKGRRPSFTAAADPLAARELYERFLDRLRGKGLRVESGVFQAHMDVNLVNDGPVTFLLDSRRTR